MKHRTWVALGLFILAGCDDGSPERQALAECMLSPNAKGAFGVPDATYLVLCMQAKGFVTDDRLSTDSGPCSQAWKEIHASCYRQDGVLGDWGVRMELAWGQGQSK